MTLSQIIENQKNTDSNGIAKYVGNEMERWSIDITGNGDHLTIVKYDNDLFCFEDDLQGQYTWFTEAADEYIEEYIDQCQEEGHIGQAEVLESILKTEFV